MNFKMNKYKLAPHLVVQKIDDETIVFDSNRATLFILNQTAGYFFRKLKIGQDLDTIINGASQYYRITKDRAKKDLMSLLKQLTAKKILLQRI